MLIVINKYTYILYIQEHQFFWCKVKQSEELNKKVKNKVSVN
jgi:hypothetical protein